MTRPTGPWILGFDIGGTKTAVSAGTLAADILARTVHPSHADAGFESMWTAMVAPAEELIADLGHPVAIGVSVGGPVDTDRGIVYSPPNLPGWDAIPLKDRLVRQFGLPTYVEHDARAGALAEWMFGAALGASDIVYLTFGTGLGAGLILGGRLYRGRSGDAGEVGHWRMSSRGQKAYGKSGSWEALASGAGLPRLARHLFPSDSWSPDLTAHALTDLARAGDARAARVVRISATWLGRGIAQIVDLLNPEVVVLGGLAVHAGDLFLPPVQRIVRRECTPRSRECRVVASGFSETGGDVAAICAAIYHGRLGEGAAA